jgi:Phosphotransferase enzyme family
MELSPSPIAEAFGPAPTGPLVAIASGPSAVHRSWRLSTSRGRFAVKAFGRDQHARGVEAWEGPVRLELAALTAGVPLPRPRLAVATGAGVAEVAGLGPQPALVRVHEWVDGSTPTAPGVDKVGRRARRHLGRDPPRRRPLWRGRTDPTLVSGRPRCGALVEAGRWCGAGRVRVGWAPRRRVPLLAEVEELAAARTAETVPLVMTHSDLVPGNVLVSATGRPWIVDWDDAGPWNAAEEVAAAVVSWSSRAHGEPDERAALALVEGYRRADGVLQDHSPTVLAGSLSALANWAGAERAPQPQPSGQPGVAPAGGGRGDRCADRAAAAAGQARPVDRAAGLTTRTRLMAQRPRLPRADAAAARRRATAPGAAGWCTAG